MGPEPNATPHQGKRLTITQHQGNLFDAPPHSVLIHACNTRGAWGAGIALQFKCRFPAAFREYRSHCRDHSHQAPLTGTSVLLAPEKDQSVWVACLFTSKGYGKNRDSEEKILENTKTAVLDLLHTVERTRAFGYTVGELRMCEINSGNFGVPWEKTLAVLEGIELREGWPDRIEVWRLDK